jgi:hypothetical protein
MERRCFRGIRAILEGTKRHRQLSKRSESSFLMCGAGGQYRSEPCVSEM